jgi:hypothetical protein
MSAPPWLATVAARSRKQPHQIDQRIGWQSDCRRDAFVLVVGRPVLGHGCYPSVSLLLVVFLAEWPLDETAAARR